VLVEEFLESSARRFPGKTALICGDRRLTYGEVEEQCNRLAHGLIGLGVERGDRVIVFMENSVEAVLSIIATLKAGGVFVVVNPTTKAEKLAYVIRDSGARVLITQSSKLRIIEDEWRGMPNLNTVVFHGGTPPAGGQATGGCVPLEDLLSRYERYGYPPEKKCIDIDLAALIYTSGSTGHPKGVTVTHLNIVSAATSITTYLENSPTDVILNVLPLSFDYGLYQMLMALKVGATLVLERSFVYPHAVVERMIKENVTGFPVVPTIVAILLQLDVAKYRFPSLRYLTNTAAVLPTPHISKLRQIFPHVKIFSMYGLTECKRVAYLPPEQVDIRPTSVGKAMPNVEAYVVDDQGRLPPGKVGELVVRGSNVMKGYWGMPEETRKMLRPDPVSGEIVLYTGDQFRMDEEGYLYFVGRTDHIIKTRGEKVSPREIENVLCSLEGVVEAAVIGVPDPILGQAVKAVVTVKEGAQLTPQDVLRHCARHLEDFMVPKVVEIRDHLPTTPTGKVNQRELMSPAGQ